MRVARLIQQNQDARFRVLGLTFTTKAADEMRGRVELRSNHLDFGTLIICCLRLFRDHPRIAKHYRVVYLRLSII